MSSALPASRTRSPATYQLHVELGGLTLMDLVDRVTRAALSAIAQDAEREALYPEARRHVERVLRQHIVAFDTCGLGSLCSDGEPFDPWPPEEAPAPATGRPA